MRFLAGPALRGGRGLSPLAASQPGGDLRSRGRRRRSGDWWGLPDDGEGPRVAGETWCGECLTLVGAGPRRCRYQWMRVGPLGAVEPIPGARGPRHVVSELDLGVAFDAPSSPPPTRRTPPAAAPILELGEETVLPLTPRTTSPRRRPSGRPRGRTGHPDDDRDQTDPEPDPASSATRARVNPLPEDAVGARGHERSEATRVRVDASSRREIILDPPEGASSIPSNTRAFAPLMEIRGRLLVERASTLPPSTSPPWFDVADAFGGVGRVSSVAAPADASARRPGLSPPSQPPPPSRKPPPLVTFRSAPPAESARFVRARARARGGVRRRPPRRAVRAGEDDGNRRRRRRGPRRATRLYRSGANEGHAECENNLGAMLCAGADPDLAGAAALFGNARDGEDTRRLASISPRVSKTARGSRATSNARRRHEKAAAAGVAGRIARGTPRARRGTSSRCDGEVRRGRRERRSGGRSGNRFADLRKAATARGAGREVPGSPGGTGDASRGALARRDPRPRTSPARTSPSPARTSPSRRERRLRRERSRSVDRRVRVG